MSIATRVLMVITSVTLCALTQAQEYPTKTVRFVVTTAAGGGLDPLCRAIAQRLSDTWGQPVVVENKSGGQGIIGYEFVARAAPDGYTLLCSGPSQVTNSIVGSKLPYDPDKDFAPITGLVATVLTFVVTPSLAAKSIGDLISLAKSKPGQLSYGSFGLGTSGHLVTEMFQLMAGIRLNHIPYKGAAPALTDIAAGHVHMMFTTMGAAGPLWRGGKVRILAVASAKRLTQYPDVPTIMESGLPGFEGSGWFGLHAPGATPRTVINRINSEIQKIFADSAFRAKNLELQGYESIVSSPEQFAAYLKSDAQKWEKVVRDANVKLD